MSKLLDDAQPMVLLDAATNATSEVFACGQYESVGLNVTIGNATVTVQTALTESGPFKDEGSFDNTAHFSFAPACNVFRLVAVGGPVTVTGQGYRKGRVN